MPKFCSTPLNSPPTSSARFDRTSSLIELAKSAGYYAAASLDEGDDDGVANAHLAKAFASDAYMQTAIHAVQIHGGIGFTWDNDTHLWFKRAKSSEVLLGDANYHRELMLQNWPA